MRLEQLPFASGQHKLRLANDFAGTFADSHVHESKFARVAPVTVIRSIDFVRRNFCQMFEQALDFFLADAIDEILETLALVAPADVIFGDRQHRMRNLLRGYRADGNPILAGVVAEFAAEYYLKMGHLKSVHIAVNTVKAD